VIALLVRLSDLYSRWRWAAMVNHPDEVRAQAERAARDRMDAESAAVRETGKRIRARWLDAEHEQALGMEQRRVEAEVRLRLEHEELLHEREPLRFRRRA